MRLFAIFFLAVVLAGCVSPPLRPDTPARDFWAQPELDARIEVARFDRGLMAEAIFQETNGVRKKLGLPAFQKLPKLDAAADLEAAVGRVYQPPSHTNPFPMIGSPSERVKYVGLNARQVAENIALLSIYEIEATARVGVIVREGQRHFVHSETQAELQPATYRGFARRVVQAWMDSPGHQANLVDPALKHLGCSVQPGVNIMGVDNLFCVQVFFTPSD